MKNHEGFTLVELLVSMVIVGVVMAGVYSAYYTQQKSYQVQEQVAGMQQNLRAAMSLMEREIRMAGYDPTGNANAGIITAGANTISFSQDITGGESDGKDNDGDGSVDEADEDQYGDGDTNDSNETITYSLYDSSVDADTTADDLGRQTGAGSRQLVAENITALSFFYLDENEQPLSSPVDTSKVRWVVISMAARTARSDPGFSKTRTLTCRVNCRNLGL